MAGHSKWANIKHKKAAVDAKRGKIFTKMSKLITIAVKESNGDRNAAKVIAAVDAAKKANVPKDNIERAIKNAADKDAGTMEEVVYEGYGPGGAGLMIVALTDNRNRTAQEVKHAFSKNGFALGAQGSVSWGFTRNAEMDFEPNPGTEVELSDEDIEKLENLVEMFEELEDVSDVYVNVQ